MAKTCVVTVLLISMLLVSMSAQDAKTVIANASKAMGAEGLDSITYSGSAAMGNFGQSRNISARLASTSIRNYTRTIDFMKPMSRATGDTYPPAGEGAPPPEPGTYDQTITPDNLAWTEHMQIWMTPWGFLRGAAANNATVRSRKIEGVPYQEVTWSPAQKAPSGKPYPVIGYINAENMVDRVETWVEHPVLGDMHVEFTYLKYDDFDGLKVPTRISQTITGLETFVVGINDARGNPPDLSELLTPPPADESASGPPPLPPVASEKLADGVYRITGGYVALAVEFRDHVVVLEGGQSEARGLAIMAETKRLFPAKRIKYVVNTHPHFDHVRGLPPFVAEGITILTDDPNQVLSRAGPGLSSHAGWRCPREIAQETQGGRCDREDGAPGRYSNARVTSHSKTGAQRRHARGVLAQRANSVHSRLQRSAARATCQPFDCNARSKHRPPATGLRPARHGPRARPRPADDQGRSSGARQKNQLEKRQTRTDNGIRRTEDENSIRRIMAPDSAITSGDWRASSSVRRRCTLRDVPLRARSRRRCHSELDPAGSPHVFRVLHRGRHYRSRR